MGRELLRVVITKLTIDRLACYSADVVESDDDLGFGSGIPDWAWKFVWTVGFVGLIVRPMLTWVRESRPMWQLVLLVLLWVPVVAAVANCWRQNNHFGINRWPGVFACAMATVLTGFAELESLRPVTGPLIYGGLATFGACWILREQKNGRSAEFPPELLQFVNRPRWKYVTPLKLDFWVIWVGMWIPILLGAWVLSVEFFSGRFAHRHWSFWILYLVTGFLVVLSTWRLVHPRRLSTSDDDILNDPFRMLNFWTILLVSAVAHDGLAWKQVWEMGLLLLFLEIPREAMERWNKRNAETGRHVYDSLEAPHLGI